MKNFQKLYNTYEIMVKESLKDKTEVTEDIIHEYVIQLMAKAITVACYRNGKIEDFHSELSDLTDERMKVLNKDVHNRVYTFLQMCLSEDDADLESLQYLTGFSMLCASNWDEPEIVEDMIVNAPVEKKAV